MDDVRTLMNDEQRASLRSQAVPQAAAAVLQAELAHAQAGAVLEAARATLEAARRIYGDPHAEEEDEPAPARNGKPAAC